MTYPFYNYNVIFFPLVIVFVLDVDWELCMHGGAGVSGVFLGMINLGPAIS